MPVLPFRLVRLGAPHGAMPVGDLSVPALRLPGKSYIAALHPLSKRVEVLESVAAELGVDPSIVHPITRTELVRVPAKVSVLALSNL